MEARVGALGGATTFTFLPYMYDYILFNQSIQYILNNVRPKRPGVPSYQDDQQQLDKVESLIVTRELKPQYDTGDRIATVKLPDDYLLLLEDETLSVCTPLTGQLEEQLEYYFVIPFIEDANPTEKWRDYKLTVTWSTIIDSTVVFDLGQHSPYGEGVDDDDEKYVIISAIRHYFPNPVVGLPANGIFTLYWERYIGVIARNSFILVFTPTTTQPAFPFLLNVNIRNGLVQTIQFKSRVRKVLTGEPTPDRAGFYSNRLIKHEGKGMLLNNSFAKSVIESPVSRINGDLLIVHYTDDFMPVIIRIFYIRRPKMLNKDLDEHCEISQTYHDEVVDIAAKSALSYNNDRGYALLKDNILT